MVVAPMVSESLTILTSGIAQDAYPLILALRSFFCVLFFLPKFFVLQVLVLVEILLPLVGSTAHLARV